MRPYWVSLSKIRVSAQYVPIYVYFTQNACILTVLTFVYNSPMCRVYAYVYIPLHIYRNVTKLPLFAYDLYYDAGLCVGYLST